MHEIDKSQIDLLIQALREEGYRVIGPRIGEGAIIYDDIKGADELPRGWVDEQAPGHYRIQRSGNDRFFDFVVGPHSWKQFLFPPRLSLLKVVKDESGLRSFPSDKLSKDEKMAFIGVRACELAAIDIQDRVFLLGTFQDQHYRVRRERSFFIAVNCTRPGGLCFCVSMKTGPRARHGFDLALTELDDVFIVEVGSELGEMVLSRLESMPATTEQLNEVNQAMEQAEQSMGRTLETSDLPGLLLENLDHPRWDDVADRCLSCTNCTMVCPTCFCSTVEEVNQLRPDESERVRIWDSCFSQEFSYVHGGTRRPTTRDRYRQWLTHKLSTWHEQFGTSGCVGCGRCIAWCPTGIDITVEVAAIRETAPTGKTT